MTILNILTPQARYVGVVGDWDDNIHVLRLLLCYSGIPC